MTESERERAIERASDQQGESERETMERRATFHTRPKKVST